MKKQQTIHGTERSYNKLPFAVYCKSIRLFVDLLLIFKHQATSKVFRNGGLTVLLDFPKSKYAVVRFGTIPNKFDKIPEKTLLRHVTPIFIVAKLTILLMSL